MIIRYKEVQAYDVIPDSFDHETYRVWEMRLKFDVAFRFRLMKKSVKL